MAKTRTLNRLVLVRKANSRSTLIDESGLKGNMSGDPLNISPLSWDEEDGLSHYGYILNGLKLGDIEDLLKWAVNKEGVTVHPIEEGVSVDETLGSVGLRINTLAQ